MGTGTWNLGRRPSDHLVEVLATALGYLDLEPSAGLRETAYYLDGYDEPAGSDIRDRRTHTREIYDLAAEGSTRLSRIFEPKLLGVEKMRHELKPFVRAEYVPYVNQRKNPYFDEEDRMERETTLTYGIENAIKEKVPEVTRVEAVP